MADFALSSAMTMKPWRSPWGAFPVRNMPLSTGISSNIIYKGSVVSLDPNSSVYQHCIVPSSQASSGGVIASTWVVGVAAAGPATAEGKSDTNAQGTLIPVWEANPLVEFVANTKGASNANNLASTLVGTYRELVWDSTLNCAFVWNGASCLATPMNRVVVTQLIDNIGDSGGRVAFKFCAKDPTSSLSTANLLAFFK